MFVYWALLLKKDTLGRSGWSQLVHRLLPFQDICRYMVRIRSLSNQNIFFLTLAPNGRFISTPCRLMRLPSLTGPYSVVAAPFPASLTSFMVDWYQPFATWQVNGFKLSRFHRLKAFTVSHGFMVLSSFKVSRFQGVKVCRGARFRGFM